MKSILSYLHRHRRLSILRDPMFLSNRTAKGFARTGSFFFLVYMCLSGYYFGSMAKMFAPDIPSYQVFNGLIVYMLLGSVMMRLITPFNPVAHLLHYGHLPVSRRLLVRWSVVWSFASKELLIWMLFLLSYLFFEMSKFYAWSECLFFGLAFLFLLLIRHFGLMWVRLEFRFLTPKTALLLGIVGAAVVAGLVLLPVRQLSKELGMFMIQGEPLLWALLLPLAALMYGLYARALAKHLYRELEMTGMVKKGRLSRFKMDDRLSGIGTMMWFEVVKWIRFKRGWLSLLTPLFFVVVLIYLSKGLTPQQEGAPSFHYFLILLGMSAPGQALRQFLFSIDSHHFDGLMTRHKAVRNLLFAKYYMDVVLTTIGALMMMPLIFLDKLSCMEWLGFYGFAVGFYNLLGYFPAIYGRARMDYTGGKQAHGVGGAQMFWSVLITITGMLIFFLPPLFVPEPWKTLFPILFGILGILCHSLFLGWIYRRFYKRRYRALSGFRGS